MVALLVGPLAIVVAASLDRTRSLLFPWLTWPSGGHLLPQPEWAAAQHVLVANRYGHPNVDLGDYLSAVRGIATSSALAPGSLLAACGSSPLAPSRLRRGGGRFASPRGRARRGACSSSRSSSSGSATSSL